jgi:hypothetical protein
MVRLACQMTAPRLVFDETRSIWRVEHAGMVREHQQYWQAVVWYEDALQSYGSTLNEDGPSACGSLG